MGRELTFADARIIAIVKENFVPVVGDDWFQRRRQDAEGEFFRKVADQGPRKGNGTRQGIYALTADGRLLDYRNHQDPDVMGAFLVSALRNWQSLPASQRGKDAIKVPELGKIDARFAPPPPKDAVIVNVYTRILERERDFFCHGTCQFPGGQRAAHDHLWIRAEEWQALTPKEVKVGQEMAVPAALRYRLARFHLIDNTRGEPPMWQRDDVRKTDLKAIVDEVGKTEVKLKLIGAAMLSADTKTKLGIRGYDVSLLGEVRYDIDTRKLTRFHLVALGNHWGEGTYTPGARPGRTPLGVAFELADPERPADRVPPQFIREGGNYYAADR